MRLKNIFSVPAGEKVTEKGLYRVLISSICSILLCMACLVSTTWAWFAVSIENTGNVIAIAAITADVTITAENSTPLAQKENGSYELEEGEYTITLRLNQETTANPDMQSTPAVYVVMTVIHGEDMHYRLFTFDDREDSQAHTLSLAGAAQVSFSVSWVKPANEFPDGSVPLVIEEVPSEPATETTAAPTTEAVTEPSAETTVPEETTESSEGL